MDLHEVEASTSSHMPKRIRRDLSGCRTDPICAKTEPIFLSHSGKDKEFVNKLYHALRNAGHDPFMDTDSLPLGEHFPPRLIQTLKACKLGVVVLSPDFLTSKWPMRELHMLHTSPSSPKILPLFYKLHPDDLKESSQWQEAWREISEKDTSLATFSQLESAAVQLPKIQGIVHRRGTQEEGDYIEEVVRGVSCIIKPLLRYDISHLTGHERLTKEVDEKFQRMPGLKARVIGFFGVGGLGKTTVCKLMVNYYASTYAGRCALIEFPTPTKDGSEKEVVSQCRKALNQLTNATIGGDRLNDLDECVEFMKQHVSSLDVFIALDNIWEECLVFAQRILDIGFSSNSKILVTSRSSEVLKNLLEGRSHVMPSPSANSEEARQMFVKCFNRNQGGQLVQLEDAQVDKLTSSYRSNGAYHPLGITALGVSLARIAGGDQSWLAANWEAYSRDPSAATDAVEKAIKINFDSLSLELRNIFLAVALIYIPNKLQSDIYLQQHCLGYVKMVDSKIWMERLRLQVWLCALYQEMGSEREIKKTLTQLEYGGLLEFEESGDVHVHDLYRDLATREASGSGNFLYVDDCYSDQPASGSGNFLFLDRQNDDDEYKKCGVIKISASKRPGITLVHGLNHKFCKGKHNMQIFDDNIHLLSSSGNRHLLSCPPNSGFGEVEEFLCAREPSSLRVLSLDYCRPWNKSNSVISLRHMRELSWLGLAAVSDVQLMKDIPKLSKLSYLHLHEGNIANTCWNLIRQPQDVLCLDGLVNLRVLDLSGMKMQEISGLGSLANLECMTLNGLHRLRKVGDFSSCCPRLQRLQIEDCECLTQVEGLAGALLPNLKILCLPALQFDQLSASHMSSLRELTVLCGYEDFKLQIQGLPSLETLYIFGASSLRRIGFSRFTDLGSLQEIRIQGYSFQEWFFNLEFQECSGLYDLPSLKHFSILNERRDDDQLYCVKAESHLDFVVLLKKDMTRWESLTTWFRQINML